MTSPTFKFKFELLIKDKFKYNFLIYVFIFSIHFNVLAQPNSPSSLASDSKICKDHLNEQNQSHPELHSLSETNQNLNPNLNPIQNQNTNSNLGPIPIPNQNSNSNLGPNPNLDSNPNPATDKATFIGADGNTYISPSAFVHAGKLINAKKFKAPHLVGSVGTVGDLGASVTIDNFLHGSKYHHAQFSLDPEAIEAVYIQTMPFPIVPGVMAGHVQARFVMKSGYEIQLIDPETNRVTESVKDMIISYEAALPKGESYNFALGAVNSSPLVGRIVSGSQKLSEGPDRIFNQYLLPLQGHEATTLLHYYLNDSIKIQMDYYYNTVIRNCTTTIFDGLDSLERFRTQISNGTLSPFLTTIGGDPVIGSTINGLLDRFGNELAQVQDMKDEYNGRLHSLGVPDRVTKNSLPFVPGGDQPMSLLVMTFGTENLTKEQKEFVRSLVDDIIRELPETLNMMMSSTFAMAHDLQTSPKMIQAVTEVISRQLIQRLKNQQASIPEEAIQIQIQFTPFPSKGNETDLTGHGIRAKLPFSVQQIEVLPENRTEILNEIQNGIQSADQNVDQRIPAFLKNFSVDIQLQKQESQLQIQFLVGLQPLTQSMDVSNDQVLLDTFEIPKATDSQPTYFQRIGRFFNKLRGSDTDSFSPVVNMLLTHKQNLPLSSNADESATLDLNPLAQINFGGTVLVGEKGTLSVPKLSKSKLMCWSGQAPHTPRLSGVLSDAPLGSGNWIQRFFNRLLTDQDVTLSITDLELNLQKLQIETTQIRVGVLGFRCLELESVNQQFGEQANLKLQDLIGKVGPGIFIN